MCVGFILLARGTSIDVFLNKLCHSRLPVSCGYKLFGFKISRVAGSLMVMEFFD